MLFPAEEVHPCNVSIGWSKPQHEKHRWQEINNQPLI